MANNLAVFLIFLSSLMITKGYLVVFAGSLFLVAIGFAKNKIKLDFFSLYFVLFIALLLCYAFRELLFGSIDHINYFFQSAAIAASYVFILSSINFKGSDSKKILWCFKISLVMQTFFIIARFLGVFDVPVPFGISPDNRGIVSIQRREQLTAVSIGRSLST